VKQPNFELFLPQPGENDANLPENYHAEVAKDLSDDMRVRLIEGQWGAVYPGSPVFKDFNFGLHTADELPYAEYEDLIRFWDFGYRHPYCGVMQMDYYGRLNVLFEVKGEDMEIRPFAQHVKAKLAMRFPNHKAGFVDYGDPAARQKKDTGSTLVELSKEGIQLRYRIMTIEPGLREIRNNLNRIEHGRPFLMFDRGGVPILISAMRGGYHFDDAGQKPVKDGYYDHPADAFRYGITNVLSQGASHTYGDLPDSIEYAGE
jgi:hypothetical protein